MNQFKTVIRTQRMIRKLDEVYLIDSSNNIILSDLIDQSANYNPPSEEMFNEALKGIPTRSSDPNLDFTSALIKLNNFIDNGVITFSFFECIFMFSNININKV